MKKKGMIGLCQFRIPLIRCRTKPWLKINANAEISAIILMTGFKTTQSRIAVTIKQAHKKVSFDKLELRIFRNR